MKERNWAAHRITAEQMIQELSKKWCWQNVYSAWCARLDDFNLEPTSLFTVLRVHDPKKRVELGQCLLAWWPAKSICEKHLLVQRHLDGILCYMAPQLLASKGEKTTIELLYEYREGQEKTAATFIAASLFDRVISSRGDYPHEKWPPFSAVHALYLLACEKMGFQRYPGPWHTSCTCVLPFGLPEFDRGKIETFSELINFLGEEAASVLLKYRMVIIEFADSPDPEIAAILASKYEEERKRCEEWSAQQAKEKEEKVRRKLTHPRCDEWEKLSTTELERLVWSMPTTRVAADFGVSDVAVAKRCERLGIAKPHLGFWSKVKAGLLPHPEGKPPAPPKKMRRRGKKSSAVD